MLGVRVPPALPVILKGKNVIVAKKKVPSKYRQKQILERQLKERKAQVLPPKKKVGWKQFLKGLPKRISKFFRDVVHELKRVTWPKRKDVWIYTIVVLVAIVFFAIVLGLFDFIFLRLVGLLIGS